MLTLFKCYLCILILAYQVVYINLTGSCYSNRFLSVVVIQTILSQPLAIL